MDDAMLRSSFILLDRISSAGEQRLWERGIADWDAFREAVRIPGLSPTRKSFYELQLRSIEAALQARAWTELARALPQREHWRLFPLLRSEALYLDIETSGYYGDITVLGAWDGSTYFNFVKGCNLSKELVHDVLSRHKMLVTFNGASFDLPVIRRYFRGAIPQGMVHIDLRHVLARLGLSGGLKSIEQRLGIARSANLNSVCGDDAVALWHQYRLTGEDEFMELLLEYNEADCKNLEPLAEFAVTRLWDLLRNDARKKHDRAS